jgi:hypothetical protein
MRELSLAAKILFFICDNSRKAFRLAYILWVFL